ncbi:hypothetical protein Efla_003816 [Eimeria flavescens]
MHASSHPEGHCWGPPPQRLRSPTPPWGDAKQEGIERLQAEEGPPCRLRVRPPFAAAVAREATRDTRMQTAEQGETRPAGREGGAARLRSNTLPAAFFFASQQPLPQADRAAESGVKEDGQQGPWQAERGEQFVAAARAVEAVNACVRSGMRVGLGTGSTASFAVRRLAERVSSGELHDISCAATSEDTRRLAESLGLSVQPLDSMPLPLDVAIDGADEILLKDNQLVLIKGRGGALLREKIVEVNSKEFICVADAEKVVDASRFGTTGAVPVEVVQFGAQAIRRAVLAAAACAVQPAAAAGGASAAAAAAAGEEAAAKLGVSAEFRRKDPHSEALFVSDNGNFCLDLFFRDPIPDPQRLHDYLSKASQEQTANPLAATG